MMGKNPHKAFDENARSMEQCVQSQWGVFYELNRYDASIPVWPTSNHQDYIFF
jgi:hypothetical protein